MIMVGKWNTHIKWTGSNLKEIDEFLDKFAHRTTNRFDPEYTTFEWTTEYGITGRIGYVITNDELYVRCEYTPPQAALPAVSRAMLTIFTLHRLQKGADFIYCNPENVHQVFWVGTARPISDYAVNINQ
jgi:hypothetical protein